MIVYGISGGAFYLRSQAVATYFAHQKGKKADMFCGTSAGAIISLVAAVLGVEKMYEFAMRINPKQAIKNAPFNNQGNMKMFSSLCSALFGKAIVKQNIIPILNTIISDEQYEMWRQNKARIEAFCTTANIDTGTRHLWALSRFDKQEALLIVEASARMQGLCDTVELRGNEHWDGGQFDHNPVHLMLDTIGNISEVVAIWSRPQDWKVANGDFQNAGFFKKLFRMIEIDNVEKSMNDESILVNKCYKKDIKLKQIYIERVLAHQYDSSEEGQNKSVQAAINAVNQAFKI